MSMNTNVQTLNEMASFATDQLKVLKDATEILIQDGYGVSLSIMQKVKGLSDEDIDDFLDDELDTLLTDNDGQAIDFTKKLEARNNELINEDKFTMLGYKRYVLKDICKNVKELDKAADSMGDIINDKNALMKEYVESILTKSPERNSKRIEILKGNLEKAETEDEKKKIQNIINIFENLNNLGYIFKDINLYSEKELDIITSNFLDPKKAEYMVNKFITKCKQMKINSQFYQLFLNMEELFLEEEYHAFNNLFLFFVMRYIAYANPYDAVSKSYALTMIMSIQKLMTNKYKTTEDKDNFLLVVKKFLDYFKPYTDRYKKQNATYKEHPVRLAHDKVLAEKLDAENMAKGILPIERDGDYEKNGTKYTAWFTGECKECGASIRYTTEGKEKDYQAQCMNPHCINHMFVDVNASELPEFYTEETPLLDDHGHEVKFSEETVAAVTEIIPEKLEDIKEALSSDVADIQEDAKDDTNIEENSEV